MADDEFSDLEGPAGIGHNSGEAKTDTGPSATVAAKQLRSVIERIERLEEERKAIADDIKEVYAEAKANGFDVKTLRKVVAMRKKPTEEREEEQALLEIYLSALGMLPA